MGGWNSTGKNLPRPVGSAGFGACRYGVPGMVEVGARPLHAVLLDPVVADPVPVGRQVGELVPHRLRVRILGPVRAERACHLDDDLAVDARLAR